VKGRCDERYNPARVGDERAINTIVGENLTAGHRAAVIVAEIAYMAARSELAYVVGIIDAMISSHDDEGDSGDRTVSTLEAVRKQILKGRQEVDSAKS